MKRALLCILSICSLPLCYAQTNQENKNAIWNITPPSPTAASITSNLATSNNAFTGKVSVSLPLFKAKGIELNVPIELSYNSNGIKISENAGWVGTGWSLSAGGTISRTVYGRPDEHPNGYYAMKKWIDSSTVNTNSTKYALINSAIGKFDLQPDIYNMSICGISGSFVTTDGVNFHTIPSSDIIICKTSLGGFEITDDKGVKYIFDSNNKEYFVNTDPWFDSNSSYSSSWNLSKIISPNNNDTIYFYYKNTLEIIYNHPPQSISVKTSGTLNNKDCSPINTDLPIQNSMSSKIAYQTQKLSKIETKFTSIHFNHNDRKDIDGGSSLLSQICVYQKQTNKLLEKYNLKYKYFGDTSNIQNSHINARLFLIGISKISEQQNIQSITHTFSYYNPELLPPKNSYSIDHWGYYNGKNNQYLIPIQQINGTSYGYANRSTDTSLVKYGMLQSITYPTGGKTVFEYESNDYYTSSTSTNNQQKSITNKAITPLSNKTNTCYQNDVSFTINNAQNILVSTNIFVEDSANECDGVTSTNAYILNDSGIIVYQGGYGTYSGNESVYLTPGSYHIICSKTSPRDLSEITVTYNEETTTLSDKEYGGGIRVKSISSIGNTTLKKQYKYVDKNGKSTGILLAGYPNYTSTEKRPIVSMVIDKNVIVGECQYTTINSSSGNDLYMIQGGYVGYSSITEIADNPQNGYVEKDYKINNVSTNQSFPYPPVIIPEWKNGLILEERFYNKTNELISKQKYYYKNVDFSNKIKGLKCGIILNSLPCDPILSEIALAPYSITLGYTQNIAKVSQQIYKSIIVSDSTYYYFNEPSIENNILPLHFYPIKEITLKSNGDLKTITSKYAADFKNNYLFNDEYSRGIESLISKHMTGTILERAILNKSAINSEIKATSSELFLYKKSPTNKVQLEKILNLKTIPNSPLTNLKITNGIISFDPNYYSSISIEKYDDSNRVLEVKERNGIVTSYIWSAYTSIPIFKGTSITHNQLYEITRNSLNYLGIASLDNLILEQTYSQTSNSQTLYNNLNSSIRNQTRNLNAQILSYLDYESKGIVQRYDAKNLQHSFNYDCLGRLSTIYENGKIASNFGYEYYSNQTPPVTPPTFLTVSKSDLTFGWLQESQAVAVSSSASWSVTSKSGTFITVSQPDSGTLSITCSKNMGASERTGQVVLSNGTSTVTVTVSQGVDPSIYSQI